MAAIVHTRMARLYAGPRTSTGSTGGGLLQTTVTASLSLDSCALPADSAGTVTSYAAAVTTMTVRVAGADTSGSWSFSRTNSAGVTSSLSSNVLTVTELTADSGYVEITATRSGYDSITKRFALSRVKAGAAGSSGATGVRGTIVTKISGPWSDSAANTQIASIASSSGSVPTTPIKGDIVSYSGGAKEYSGSAWEAVAAYINGSLVVNGTLAAEAIAAGGAVTGATVRTSSGSTRVELDATTNTMKVYNAGANTVTIGGPTDGSVMTSGDIVGVWAVSSGAGISAIIGSNSSSNSSSSGVKGDAAGGIGVRGESTSGIGVYAASSTGISLSVAGTIQWGTYTYAKPNGSTSQYLRADGTWATPGGSSGVTSFNTRTGSVSLTSSDVTDALGFTPVSSSGSVTSAQYLNYSGGAYMQTGSYKAVMQTDGNFVVYGVSTWGAGTNVSDRRQKRNIRPTKEAGLPMIDKLRVVDFEWKKKSRMWDGGKRHTGFIAQEVGALIPDAMTETDGLCFLHKEEIVPYLVKAVQELAEEVRTLRAQLH